MYTLKKSIQSSPVYDWVNKYRNWREWVSWSKGNHERVPHRVKRDVLRTFGRHFDLQSFVETGTFFGDMVDALKDDFQQIQSIELDEFLSSRAMRRFARHSHISILRGDSAEMLPLALKAVQSPTLFWLDAHYSGGITACGKQVSPIVEELEHIFNHPIRGHVIVIDDAQLFGTDPGYPTLDQLREFASSKSPQRKMEVDGDSIRIYEI